MVPSDDATGESLGRVSDTASLGAAFRALHSYQLRESASADSTVTPTNSAPSSTSGGSSPPSTSAGQSHIASTTLVRFNAEHHAVYTSLLANFERKQQAVVLLLNTQTSKL